MVAGIPEGNSWSTYSVWREELGRSQSQKDMEHAEDYPSPDMFSNRFASWTEAKQEAGLETHGKGNNMCSREELLQQLNQLAEELGREPEIRDVEGSNEYASFQTFVNRFGSWTTAKEETCVRKSNG